VYSFARHVGHPSTRSLRGARTSEVTSSNLAATALEDGQRRARGREIERGRELGDEGHGLVTFRFVMSDAAGPAVATHRLSTSADGALVVRDGILEERILRQMPLNLASLQLRRYRDELRRFNFNHQPCSPRNMLHRLFRVSTQHQVPVSGLDR